jgi:hypothetical protein
MTAADIVDDIITRVKNAGANTYIRGKCEYVHADNIYDPEELAGIQGRSRLFTVTTDGGFSLTGPMGTIVEWTEIETTCLVSVLYELPASVKTVTKTVLEDRDRLTYHLTRADYYPTGVSRRVVDGANFTTEDHTGGSGILELTVSTLYQPTFS